MKKLLILLVVVLWVLSVSIYAGELEGERRLFKHPSKSALDNKYKYSQSYMNEKMKEVEAGTLDDSDPIFKLAESTIKWCKSVGKMYGICKAYKERDVKVRNNKCDFKIPVACKDLESTNEAIEESYIEVIVRLDLSAE